MKTKRILSLVLALVLVLSVALSGCGNNNATSADPELEDTTPVSSAAEETKEPDEAPATAEGGEPLAAEVQEEVDPIEWITESTEVYDMVFGEYMDAYDVARAELIDNDKRTALMAVAEAKFLEASAAMPTMSSGGNYRLTRVAPYTYGYADWSGEGSSYEDCLVTTEPITAADYDEMVAYWNEHRGDGTYMDWAKTFLTDKGYEMDDQFAISYSNDPKTWDPMNTSRAADGQFSTLTYDPLYGYNAEAKQVPGMAESYEKSEDGLTYTFHIRKGLKWVDSQGRDLGPVTADDWVAGMQHVLDAKAGLETLLEGIIVNADAYNAGEITDFAEVGVKAVDDNTLVYTLPAPVPYFMSMLGYSIFAPLKRDYYESMGGTFGVDFDEGNYGVDADSIAYCGPFLVKNHTKENICTFVINEAYWDYANTNVKEFSYTYNDGSDTTKSYTDFMAGTTDLQTLNTATLEIAKSEGTYPDLVHTTLTGGTTYMSWINLNRKYYHNTNDDTAVVSEMTVSDAERAVAAAQNVHFRRALMFAIDRVKYRAQTAGDDLAPLAIRNSYVPGTFGMLENETTIDINGTATTFPAGTFYGEILQAQLDADGVAIKAWDSAKGTGDGYDGWYSPANAAAELEIAIEELAAQGVEISEEKPLILDTPCNSSVETSNNQANFLKQCMEAALGGKVQINLTNCVDTDQYYYTGYYIDNGYEANYNLYLGSGWGPDYADASTFLDTLLPDGAGYMTMLMGCF